MTLSVIRVVETLLIKLFHTRNGLCVGSMASSSPWETIDRRSTQRQVLVQALDQIIQDTPQLSTVKTCAMIGCGYGHLDLAFVTGYMYITLRLQSKSCLLYTSDAADE